MRRLERDQRDSYHLNLYAKIAGITPSQVKAVLDAFFGERELSHLLSEQEHKAFTESLLYRAEEAERRLERITGTVQSVSYQLDAADRDLGLNLKHLER